MQSVIKIYRVEDLTQEACHVRFQTKILIFFFSSPELHLPTSHSHTNIPSLTHTRQQLHQHSDH